MYCPRCGQQQITDEVRFCPRCGLSLAGVPSLLFNEGMGPAGLPPQRARGGGGLLSGRREGTRSGAKLMFFSLILAPIAFIFCFPFDSPVPLLLPLALFLAGLSVMLYSYLFGEDLLPARWTKGQDEFGGARTPRELSAPPFVPASGFAGQRVNTAEIAQQPPPSVTEQTTKLLDKE